jgi:xanthine dehydrogenase YagR molybdenum-binding subunit
MNDRIGDPLTRVDGPLKVMGRATYAAEFDAPNLCHAVMVRSTVPVGTIVSIDTAAAKRMPGVLLVMTHENAPRLPQKGRAAVQPPAGRECSLLQEAVVRYNGEPIAVVVAESLEQATEAAAALPVAYGGGGPVLDLEIAKRTSKPAKMIRGEPDKKWGDAQTALAGAPVKVDQVYRTPMEHHNPMEPHATVAVWNGDELTLYDATQYVDGARGTVAKTLGIPPEKVRVVCPYVGGGFGCKGSTWSHVMLAAMAAKQAGRPVKLVLQRPQMFGPVGGRPLTEQHIVLGANRDGKLVALKHDVISHTSVFEDFAEPATQPTKALYSCPNGATTQKLVEMNVGTPTFQRAPGEATGTFAIESAMDELAYELGIDPLELRLINHADVEPSSGKPWSSKKLREAYEDAARRFGWSKRNPKPRSMRDGRWLVGWGMATATYPAHRLEARAIATLNADGTYLVRSGTQDLGTGTYTICTQIAAETLGVEVRKVRFELGDTRYPKAPVSGGSMTAASVGPAVKAACLALKEKMAAGGKAPLTAEGTAAPGPEEEDKKRFAERSWGALFGDVRVDEDLGIIRVPRIVATYTVGRVLNAKTGRSQFEGGIVWGLGQALFEESLLDRRTGRIANSNLAEYHVPVNADVGSIEVSWVEENDTEFNDVGARGIGEIGITGVAGMVANAVYHATGKRIRELPITLDKLL